MRGKVALLDFVHVHAGITPAYAGKSRGRCQKEIVAWDHPRVCGEKSVLLFCIPSRLGSPPRMRGKGALAGVLVSVVGITPAYAGKSGFVGGVLRGGEDHPRVCGEKVV